jgi:hypothetical protein
MRTNREGFIEAIERLRIGSLDIANVAGVDIQRVSEYKTRRSVSPAKCAAIQEAIAKIALVRDRMGPVRIDTRDALAVEAVVSMILEQDRQALEAATLEVSEALAGSVK